MNVVTNPNPQTHSLSGEYRSFVKHVASGTGHKGFGQECDLSDIFRAFKQKLKVLDKLYHLRNKKVKHSIDSNFNINEIEDLLPKEHQFWDGFEDSELVEWLKTRISGHNGPATAGFCLQKFWMLARYLYVYEHFRDEFASSSKVIEGFHRCHNYPGADPLGPLKSCVDYQRLTHDERRLF